MDHILRDSHGSAVGIAIGYGLDDLTVGVRVPVDSIIFTSYSPNRLWDPPPQKTNSVA
jgi:hypothetical protein